MRNVSAKLGLLSFPTKPKYYNEDEILVRARWRLGVLNNYEAESETVLFI